MANFIQKAIAGLCGLYTDDEIKELKNQIENNTSTISELNNKIKEYTTTIKSLENNINSLTKEKEELNKKIYELECSNLEKDDKIKELEEKIKELESQIKPKPEMCTITFVPNDGVTYKLDNEVVEGTVEREKGSTHTVSAYLNNGELISSLNVEKVD